MNYVVSTLFSDGRRVKNLYFSYIELDNAIIAEQQRRKMKARQERKGLE